jgi:pimeloyl-ACP methyl ester carboxylesterase
MHRHRSLPFVFAAATTVAASTACTSDRPVPDPPLAALRTVGASFKNGDVTLAGTLFLPAGAGPHPAVVLFHGSGPQGRDVFTASWFAEHGVAALAYDKRGVNESTGDFRKVSFTDLAADGLAGVAWLKARADIDAKRIGAWGLSQGGWLGPLAASQSRDIAFVIAVSGPGVSPGEQMVFYFANEMRAQGFGEADVEEASDFRRAVWHFLSTGDGSDAARRALDRGRTRPWFSVVNGQSDGVFGRPTSELMNDPALRQEPWYRVEANYDPRTALRALTVPALFIFGSDDRLVPVERSVEIIRETLTRAGHRDFSIKVFPHADHALYVSSPDGGMALAPGYLVTLDGWLRRELN